MSQPKVYRGIRGDDRYGIVVNDEPLHHVMLHSPAGFSWGYHGSGPADAALSILADHFNESPSRRELFHGICRCWALHQDFMREVIANLPIDQGWTLTTAEIEAFVARHLFLLADADEKIAFWTAMERADHFADNV